MKTGYGSRGENRSRTEIKQKLVEAKFHIDMMENHGNWLFIKAINKM
ncbi:MAG: hypothetical protein JSW11_20760 [Candidatus Heimdallarchaeota archaeon]|nr:MAG: hypothetical protein JSW11_20760 [Candidatus Heimdallarchaeota archaeon]